MALKFATAFYAQILQPASQGYAVQFAQMAAVSLFLELLAAGIYAAGGSRLGALAKRFNVLGWIMKLSGGAGLRD